MNKQSISFKADEQKLTKTGGIEHYASNIVAYIEATFDLGTNWSGYDSVRAVWSNDYLTDISTVLDPDGKCIVPTEVLTDTGNVTVNLVGSIADGDTLTDRLTTYPCKAVIVDADAKVEGEETESITPSQFEQFVEIVHDEVEQVTGMTAEAETLPAGSDATASYSDGVLSFGIPRGDKGEQGEQGETGHTGEPAGFGDVTASVDNTVGTPSVNVTASGPDTAKEFDFEFHNLKGEQGDTGETGETGNGIASTVLNPDYTLTITFTDGTSYTTPSIRGAKGDTGDTGATGNGIQSTVLNADYTLTITFTDGTSYTTPSIRGEQGPAGPVSDVTVNGTSVVDQNGVAVITMPELVKTVNGNLIVLDDAFGEVKNLDVELLPIQDLHGYDKPWAAGAGTNKFDGVTEYGRIDYSTGQNVSYAGTRSKNYVPVVPSTSYYIKTPDNLYIIEYDANQDYIRYKTYFNNNVYTSSADAYYIRFYLIIEGATGIAVNYPSTVTTYSPYSNICPITGHDSVTVTDTGINQWDEQWELGGINTTTGAKETATNRIRSKNYIPVSPNATYNYIQGTGATMSCGRATFYDKALNFVGALTNFPGPGASAANPSPFTAPAGAYYMLFSPPVSYGATYHNDISINLPSTDTAYHAYHGQSKTVTLPHTVYGAGVGVTSGSGKEKRVYEVLNGSETGWSMPATSYYMIGRANLINDNNTATIISDTFVGESWSRITGLGIDNAVGVVNGQTIRFHCTSITTLADWKTWLGNNNVQICYELATPLDLSTTQTDLTLYNGDNVVSSDGVMTMDYVQDMAIVIRKIESQL